MRSVLIVEDDDVYRAALGRSLRRSGFEPLEVDGVESSLSALRAGAPAYAVVDLALPDGSGIDVIRAIVRARPACRVVMLTAHGTVAGTVEAMRAGACDVRTKPISTEALVRALEDAEPSDASAPLERVASDHFQRVLDTVDGNVSEAARRLGLHRRTVQRRLKKVPYKG